MKKNLPILLMLMLFLFGNDIYAQRTCGSHEHMLQQMDENPTMRENVSRLESFTESYTISAKGTKSTVTIPVYVHVIYNTDAENISKAQIESQITVLNKDFSGANTDISGVPTEFTAVTSTDPGIQFVLAGIDRTHTDTTAWATDDRMKDASFGGVNPIAPETHMNLWVCNLADGILGYAQFPGGTSSTDGVVFSPTVCGSTDYDTNTDFNLDATYNKGRTATHEIGHYLNLRHIWGDGDCTADDFVDDTPISADANYGCPAYPTVSCSSNDMTMNYMDYTDDACMYMFTQGQATRMQAALTDTRTSLAIVGTNLPPLVIAGGPYTEILGNAITFSSTGSTDADGEIVSYAWNFGDGTTSTLPNPSHTFTTLGNHTVTLSVTDDGSAVSTVIANVKINVSATDYLMATDTIVTDFGKFYDDGGAPANYSSNINDTLVFKPATEGKFLKFDFTAFNTEPSYDYLKIFDGASADSTQIGIYSGTTSPGIALASNADGALTFVFRSDGSVQNIGWVANITAQFPSVNMAAVDTVFTDNAVFYDDGGANANYSNSLDDTIVFMPKTNGNYLQANFTAFGTESNFDFLYVYNGSNTDSTLIGTFAGTDLPNVIKATNTEGALTFRFYSDGSNTALGWEANVTSKPFLPGFYADVMAGVGPFDVQFTDTTLGTVTSWAWDFGDGSTSTEQNPLHSYSSTGLYAVSLTVSDGTNSETSITSDYITVTETGIVKTKATGGNWNDVSTWIGGVLPAASDSVIIDGNVLLNVNGVGRALYVNSGDTLKMNTSAYRIDLEGSITNYGTILATSSFCTIDFTGDIANYGEINNPEMVFGGTNDQLIYVSDDSEWVEGKILNSDSTAVIIVGSDLDFYGVYIDLVDDNSRIGVLEIPKDSAFTIYADSTDFRNMLILGNGNDMEMTNEAEFNFNVELDSISLYGNAILNTNVVFNDVTLEDTITNYATANAYVDVYGTFINNGLVTGATNFEGIIADFYGDVISNGAWKDCQLNLKASADQSIVLQNDSTINEPIVLSANVIGATTYQWTREGVNIADQLAGTYTLSLLDTLNGGDFICVTDLGNSRTISLDTAPPLPPVVDFDFNISNGVAPLTVSFTDSSEETVLSWAWDFNNDGIVDATTQNASFTFDTAGVYTVKLAVNDGVTTNDSVAVEVIHVLAKKENFSTDWTWQNPIPTGNRLHKTCQVSDDLIYVAGDGGLVLKTSDGGNTWENTHVGLPVWLSTVDFINDTVGYASGDDGRIFKTFNGGLAWYPIENNISSSSSIDDLWFFDNNEGVAITHDGYIYKTFNGGFDWEQVYSGGSYKTDVYFINDTVGFVVGGNSYTSVGAEVLKTTDAGATWTAINVVNSNAINSITFTDDNTGYIVGASGTIHKTTDVGETWSLYTFATPVSRKFNEVLFTDVNTGYIVCDYNYVYKTTDAGATWTVVYDVYGGSLLTLAENANGKIIAFGENGLIMHSIDAGINWEFEHFFTFNSNSEVEFIDYQNGYLASYGSGVLKTNDGGQSWQYTKDSTSAHYAINVVSIDTIYAAGSSGFIKKSTDAGESWSTVYDGPNSLYAIQDIGKTVYACGYGGAMAKSLDDGLTWTELTSPTTLDLWDLLFIDENVGFVVGGTYGVSQIFKTTNGGTDWVDYTGAVFNKTLKRIVKAGTDTLFVCGNDATVLRSVDLGLTWTDQTIVYPYSESFTSFNAIDFIDGFNGIVSGVNGAFNTTDGGVTWILDSTMLGTDIKDIEFVHANKAIAVANYGGILKYQSGPDPALPLAAKFTVDTLTGVAPLTVQFTDVSTGTPTSWKWDFNNDGIVDATTQSPSHVFDTAGVYTVKLIVSDGVAKDSVVKTNLLTVTAPIVALNLPFYDNFEYTNGQLPTAYVQHDIDGDGYSFVASNALTLEGSYSGMVYTGGNTGHNWLVLPKLAFPSDKTIELSFKAKSEYASYPESFQILVSTTNTDTASFSAVGVLETVDATTTSYLLDLSLYAGNECYIALRHKTSNGWRFWIDELKVEAKIVNPLLADFVVDTLSGSAPLTVQFTDASTGGATSWAWNFGDGGVSTLQHANHIYATAGTYTVTLSIGDGTFSDDTVMTNLITVVDPIIPNELVANFVVDTLSGSAPLTVQFTDASTGEGITSWAWNFGDGGVSAAQNPNHVYTTAGTYSVTLSVGDGTLSDDTVMTDLITVNAASVPSSFVASFSVDSFSGEAPLTVQFTDASTGEGITSWQWDFDNNGIVDATTQNPSYTYSTVGSYTVKLIVSDGTNGDDTVMVDLIKVTNGGLVINGVSITTYDLTESKIEPADANAYNFGYMGGVSIDGNFALVGSYSDGELATSAGSAYIFENVDNVWTQKHKLLASNGSVDDWFGFSVSIDSSVAVVGAPSKYGADKAGMVIVYRNNGAAWVEEQILTPSNGTAGDRFGNDVQVKGDYIIVGASDHVNGAAYIYHFNGATWDEQAVLSSGHENVGSFGYKVAINANTAFVSDVSDSNNDLSYGDAGAVYVYTLVGSTWTNVQRIVPSELEMGRNFGFDMAFDGQMLAVTSPEYNNNLGKIYTYANNGINWELNGSVTGTLADQYFAHNVAIDGAYLVAGEYQNSDKATYSGLAKVYWFKEGVWTLDSAFYASDAGFYDYFGCSVDIDGTSIISGAYAENAAYIYNVMETVSTPVIAEFSSDIVSGDAPLAVQFTDASTGEPTSWLWDFGDGNTSTAQNPSYTYSVEGTYSVSLKVSNASNTDSISKAALITVSAPSQVVLTAAFNVDKTLGDAPLTVNFSDVSTGAPTSWNWDFNNDGLIDSYAQNPSYTFGQAGVYDVKLTVKTATDSSVVLKQGLVTVTQPAQVVLTALFNADKVTGAAPLMVQFTDASIGSITSWTWDFGDGNSSTEQSPSHTYSVAGSYTVSLSVGDGATTALESKANFITVSEANVVLSLPYEDNFEYSSKVLPSIYTQHNVDGDANIFIASDAITLEGSYSAMVYTGGNAGENWLVLPKLDFPSDQSIEISFVARSEYDSYPESFEVLVSTTSTDISSFTSVSGMQIATQAKQTFTFNLSNFSGNECYVAIRHKTDKGWRFWIDELKVQTKQSSAIVAGFSTDKTTGDAPLAIQFNDESTGNITSWLWEFGDGNTSTAPSPMYTYYTAGTYTVKLTVNDGTNSDVLTKTDLIVVNGGIIADVVAAFSANVTSGKAPLQVSFTDESTGGATSWSWDFGDGNTSSEQNPTHTYASAGLFTVKLAVSNGSSSDELSKAAYIQVGNGVGIDFDENLSLNCYPNPTSSSLNIVFIEGTSLIKILNVQGQVVYSNDDLNGLNVLKVDVSGLRSGVYFVKSIAGGTSEMIKIIKE